MAQDNTIALQVQQPDMMKKLGSLIDMGKSQLELQKARELYPTDVARSQAESRGAVANSNVEVQTQAPRINQSVQSSNQANISTSSAQFGLDKAYMGTALETAGGLMQDPRITAEGDKYNAKEAASAILESEKQMVGKGVPELQARMATAPFYNAVGKPGAIKQMLSNTIQGQQSAQGQAAQSLIPANSQQTPGTDTAGNPAIFGKNQFGEINPIKSAPIDGQAPTLPSAPLPDGETQQSKQDLITRRTSINDVASQVPNQHYNNQQIKSILNKGGLFSTTGSNADFMKKIGSYIGGLGTDEATNINSINHYLALQTQSGEKAMGVHTDAGQKLAGDAVGSSMQDPKSLKTTVNINDATQSALDFFRRGNEVAIKNGNNVFAQRDFQNQWSQTYGRYGNYAMRLSNAGHTGDKEEILNIATELGGEKSPKYKAMLFTAQKLDNLAKKGKQ